MARITQGGIENMVKKCGGCGLRNRISGWAINGVVLFIVIMAVSGTVKGQSISGTTGLFYIPTAEMMDDKTVMFGVHHLPKKYTEYGDFEYHSLAYFGTVTFLPRVELMFRYTRQIGAERGPDISHFMDRMVAARVLLVRESANFPALAAGMHDPGFSLGLAVSHFFSSNYIVGSKTGRFLKGKAGIHLGYAFDLFDQKTRVQRGFFGGVSISPGAQENLDFIAEYDSFYFNMAARLLLFKRFQVLAGLRNMDVFSGGISYRIQL